MKKAKKTGIVVATAVGATGLAFSVSPGTAHAATPDQSIKNTKAIAETTTTSPQSAAEAQKVADAAKTDFDAAQKAVNAAQSTVNSVELEVKEAEDTLAHAQSEAEKAFDSARDHAAKTDSEAQEALTDAENSVAEAESSVQKAESDSAAATAALHDAEKAVNEAQTNSNVTQSDLDNKTNELNTANQTLSEAQKAVNTATANKEQAESALSQKESEKQSADQRLADAQADKAAADERLASAETAAAHAAQELQDAINQQNGDLDITGTVQYQNEQSAKAALEQAQAAANAATEAVSQAERDVTNAQFAVEAAESALSDVQSVLADKETALETAQEAKAAAQAAVDATQASYDHAADEVAKAQIAEESAQADKVSAETAVSEATDAKNAADQAVAEAANAVEAAQQDAEAAASADIAVAQSEVAQKASEAEAAQSALNAVEENYNKGTLGLIEWALMQEGLSQQQINDLNQAKTALLNAAEEDFSKWAGGNNTGLPVERNNKVIVIGDQNDATNLENLLKSIEILKKINELRASDDNFTGDMARRASYTNFRFMAIAEAGAMRGAGLHGHSYLATNCENLAFGYSDPNAGWYTKEKKIFDRIKNELGISKITSIEDVRRIEQEAKAQGVVIGHYTNLFYADEQLMGVGYTDYNATSCYNASKASNFYYKGQLTTHFYTVEEFEALVLEYCQTVNKKACEQALADAIADKTAAENNLQTLLDNRDAAVEAAVHDAEATLSVKETEVREAADNLERAKQTLANADSALASARANQAAAEQTLSETRTAMEIAAENSRIADTSVAYARSERDEAQRAVDGAQAILRDAQGYKADAEAVLADKQSALGAATIALNTAQAVYDEAAAKLAELTSDETIDRLREVKETADASLQEAQSEAAFKEAAKEEALAEVRKAAQDVSDAESLVMEAQNLLADAVRTRDAAQENVNSLSDELDSLKSQYASVKEAISAHDKAKSESDQAKAALDTAKEDLSNAQTVLANAQKAKEESADLLERASALSLEDAMTTPIEDEDFIYLNEYVNAIKNAKANLERVKAKLDAAIVDLLAKQNERDTAQRAYLAALADLAIMRDREKQVANTNYTPISESIKASMKIIPAITNTMSPSRTFLPALPTPTASTSQENDVSINDKFTSKPASPSSETSVFTTIDSSKDEVAKAAPVSDENESSRWFLLFSPILAGAGIIAILAKKRRNREKVEQ